MRNRTHAFERRERIGAQIQRIIAPLIREHGAGKKQIISVARADTSKDLSHCTVYVTVLGSGEQSALLDDLNAAAGSFRSAIARELQTKKTPALKFKLEPPPIEID
ncbi:MAG: 30S ribosome-binding factor RbfA [Pseudomonadota bacterium]